MAVSRVPPIVSVPQGASPEVASAFRQLNVLLQTTNDRLDALEGLRGSPTMNAALNMRGNPIHDVGSPSLPGDVVTLGYLQGTAAAQAPASPAATGLAPGSVGTWNVQASAISANVTTTGTDNTYGPAETVIGTATITTNGGLVLVMARFQDQPAVGWPSTLRLRKGSLTGAVIDSLVNTIPGTVSLLFLLAVDPSASKSQTYVVTVQAGGGGDIIKSLKMNLINFKK